MGGFDGSTYELSGGESPEEIAGARLTVSVFPTLGVPPELGRVFSKQEDDGHQPVALISDALWQSRYHRDPQVLGSAIELDRKAYSIIGVMPRSFEFPVDAGRLNKAQLWVPLSLTPDELSDQAAGFFGYRMVARLKEGVSVASAAQDADRVAHEIMRNYPAAMAAIRIRGAITPLHEYVVGETRPILRALFAAVTNALLIACVNVAVLLACVRHLPPSPNRLCGWLWARGDQPSFASQWSRGFTSGAVNAAGLCSSGDCRAHFSGALFTIR